MKRLTILAAMAAFFLMSQSVAAQAGPPHQKLTDVAGKPEPAASSTPAPPVAPAINSAKLWRLVSKTQALRTQLDASEAGRAVKEAEAELQAEQSRLAALCGPGFILDYDRDPKSTSFQDVICVKADPKDKENGEPKQAK